MRKYWLWYTAMAVLAMACSKKAGQKDMGEAPALPPVPPVFHQAADSGFSMHQDTLYYMGKKYSGHLCSLYPGGDTATNGSWLNGLETGIFKTWYRGGKMAAERLYHHGKKEGLHRGWWENGQLKFAYSFRSGEHHGELKEWYSNGLLSRWFHYNMGYEEGSQKAWWDNGTIRANYVIRNGKRYGLQGLKLCSNPYDSVIKK